MTILDHLEAAHKLLPYAEDAAPPGWQTRRNQEELHRVIWKAIMIAQRMEGRQ